MNRTIITVVGKDTKGIIAKSLYLFGREGRQYPGYLSDHRTGVLQHDDDC